MVNNIFGTTMMVEICIAGQLQFIFRRESDGQYFVEAQLGRPYVIRVTPFVKGRLEVISSVDGRNTLKNEPAHPINNLGMIITSAWDITGFRLSQNETAQFFFGNPEGSVADVVTGSTKNVGVIGLATYREYQQFNPPPAIRPTIFQGEVINYGSPTRDGIAKGGESSDAGTHAGEARFDPVGTTTFRRATTAPVEMITIQYRTLDWLISHGIVVGNEPNPWPGYPTKTGYDFLRRK